MPPTYVPYRPDRVPIDEGLRRGEQLLPRWEARRSV